MKTNYTLFWIIAIIVIAGLAYYQGLNKGAIILKDIIPNASNETIISFKFMSDESVCNATGNFWRNVPDGKDKIVPDHCECLKDNETFVSGQGCVPLCTLDPQDCICKFDAKVVHPEYENTCN